MANITKKGDRKYLIRISKGAGKSRKWINKTFRGSLGEARAFAREQETLIDQGFPIFSLKHNLLAYSELWLSSHPVKPKTKQFYTDIIKCYAKPLHDLALNDVTADHIQAVYLHMLAEQLSPNTVRHLHSTLRSMFNWGIKRQHLHANPCLLVDLPKRKRTEIKYLLHNEAARFLMACQTAKNGIVFEFALETGMRPEEYLALRRTDIDMKYHTASINRVVIWLKGRTYFDEDTKTKLSRRLVPLSPELMERIRDHLRSHGHDLLFPNAVGKPFSLKNLTNRHLHPVLKEAGLKTISLYGLRHTCATMLLLAGENPKIVQERLGHSSVVMTLDTYSHVLPHMQEAATSRLSSLIRGKEDDAHKMHTYNDFVQ